MVRFETLIRQFPRQGEKTGWTYIDVPADIIAKLKPGNKKSFRIKGKLDNYSYEGMGLIPMGKGAFILTLNATIRKAIKKQKGHTVKVQMEIDLYEKPLCAALLECLGDEPAALEKFKSLTPSNQRYFSNWIESAKTEHTKTKRITQSVIALAMGMNFPEMLRRNKRF